MNQGYGWLALAYGGVLAIIVILFCLPHGAFGHDHNRPDLDSWYPTLRSSGHGPCCDGPGKDATHLDDIDWTTQNKDASHYRVRIEGEWYDVPDDAVITEPNKDGRALVWTYPQHEYHADGSVESHVIIRCFMPGTMG